MTDLLDDTAIAQAWGSLEGDDLEGHSPALQFIAVLHLHEKLAAAGREHPHEDQDPDFHDAKKGFRRGSM